MGTVRYVACTASCDNGSHTSSQLQMVGQGAYGEVALVEDVNTRKRYAMKLIERGYKVCFLSTGQALLPLLHVQY